MERTSTIIGLVTLNFIDESINPALKRLQTKRLSHHAASHNLKALCCYFDKIAIEDFKSLFEKANKPQEVITNSDISLNRKMILEGYKVSEDGWYNLIFYPAIKEFSASLKIR